MAATIVPISEGQRHVSGNVLRPSADRPRRSRPVPKKADWPNDSSPVKPNRMSKPMPNRPQTRIRLTVFGAKPRCGSTRRGSTNGASDQSDGCHRFLDSERDVALSISGPEASLAASPCRAVRAAGTRSTSVIADEQHDVGVAGVEHRGDADDLAGDQSAQNGAGERSRPRRSPPPRRSAPGSSLPHPA